VNHWSSRNETKDYLSGANDTIAAISTPIGESSLGIVRISGKNSIQIAVQIFKGKTTPLEADSHKLIFGKTVNPETKEEIDEVYLVKMNGPKSFSGEDLVEITCHGNYFILTKILELILKQGARLALPGEFSFRAFLNGRIDLAQAEAVCEIIKAKSDSSLKLSLRHLKGDLSQKINLFRDTLVSILAEAEASIDFSEEDIQFITHPEIISQIGKLSDEISKTLKTYEEGKLLKEGINVVIIGNTNVGKSSILNALLRQDRAIVTPIPGTTRDTISEYITLEGLSVRLVDTAGLRISKDQIELEGIKRTKIEIKKADLILLVLDASLPFPKEDQQILQGISKSSHFIVINKIDLVNENVLNSLRENFPKEKVVLISALKEIGIDKLRGKISSFVRTLQKEIGEEALVSNLRHKEALERSLKSLNDAKVSCEKKMSFEFVALDLRKGLDSLGEIVGKVYTEDILNKIFSEFCIGK
jgi:tRNA modification GTPase